MYFIFTCTVCTVIPIYNQSIFFFTNTKIEPVLLNAMLTLGLGDKLAWSLQVKHCLLLPFCSAWEQQPHFCSHGTSTLGDIACMAALLATLDCHILTCIVMEVYVAISFVGGRVASYIIFSLAEVFSSATTGEHFKWWTENPVSFLWASYIWLSFAHIITSAFRILSFIFKISEKGNKLPQFLSLPLHTHVRTPCRLAAAQRWWCVVLGCVYGADRSGMWDGMLAPISGKSWNS